MLKVPWVLKVHEVRPALKVLKVNWVFKVLDDDETIIYNPILDRLLLYDYKVAHGMIAESDAVRNSCIDEKAYLRKIPLHIYKSAKSITSGYTIKLYKMSGSSMTQISVGMNEVLAINTSYIA